MNVILIGNGFDIANGIEIKFSNFVKWLNEEKVKVLLKSYANCFTNELWSEYCDNFNIKKSNKWSDFEGYLYFLIRDKGFNRKMIKTINILFEKWFDEILVVESVKKPIFLEKIFNENNFVLALSLNYTSTLMQYGFEKSSIDIDGNQSFNLKKMEGKFLNLHHVEKSPKYIIGNDLKDGSNKTRTVINMGYPDKYKHSIFNQIKMLKYDLHIYGYSFGLSDTVTNCLIRKLSLTNNIKIYLLNEEFEDMKNMLKNGIFKNRKNIEYIAIK